LTALQVLPMFAGSALLLRLAGSPIVDGHYGAVAFVLETSLLSGLMVPFLSRNFPSLFKSSYEPLFFDASLSLSDKIMRWLAQPLTSWRLLTSALMLSVLAVAVLSVG
jgi:hypothetical protein